MELQDALAAFDAQLEADGRSHHTRKQYARHVAALGRWLRRTGRSLDLSELDHRSLALFIASPEARLRPDGSAKQPTSMNALRTSLRTLFGYLADAELIPSNPAKLLRRARCAQAPPRAMRPDEVEQLLAHLAATPGQTARRDEMLVRLMLGAGLRIGAAVGLDVEDLDLKRGEARVRRDKNARPATALLPPCLVAQLTAFVADRCSGPLFLSNRGKRATVRQMQRRFGDAVGAAGLRRRVTPHACRHTFATRLLRQTGNLQLVRRALGHANIVSTAIYAATADEDLRLVLNASRL